MNHQTGLQNREPADSARLISKTDFNFTKHPPTMKSISQALAERLTFEQIKDHILTLAFILELSPKDYQYHKLLQILVKARQIKRENRTQ